MSEERVVVGDVPARLYVPRGAAGLLLLGHGGGHSKDGPRFVQLSRRYAQATDLAVVCIDAVDHGERRPVGATSELPPGWHSSVTSRMVQDWQSVVGALSSIGPAVAYVGFSMGAIFGAPTVAAIPTIEAAVFVVGGIPTGNWIDDAPLRPVLQRAAARLDAVDVLMLNMTDDELFSVADAQALFDATRARSKRQVFLAGEHDDWSDELIIESTDFLGRRASRTAGAGAGSDPEEQELHEPLPTSDDRKRM